MNSRPQHQIRALFDESTIRVYQAYNDQIADFALARGTFVSPPFKVDRMTWIKPSFLWMMYRAGWGFKDAGQARILAIDISREGFEWALANSCPSHPGDAMTQKDWQRMKTNSPVRIQWDPERDLHLNALPYRSVQIGLSKVAVELYVSQWIRKITDITDMSHAIHALISRNDIDSARAMLPNEAVYPYDGPACHPA